MGNWTIRKKLVVAFLLVGSLPVAAVALVANQTATHALDDAATLAGESLNGQIQHQLESLRTNKRAAVQAWFATAEAQVQTFAGDIAVAEAAVALSAGFASFNGERAAEGDAAAVRAFYDAQFAPKYQAEAGSAAPVGALVSLDAAGLALQRVFIADNPNPLGQKHKLTAPAGLETAYTSAHARFHPGFRAYLEAFGYYDIFLADWETGHVFYSVFKEIDFATSLAQGPHARSGLGEAWRRAKAEGKPVLQDFGLYTPSFGAPAGFIAAPVRVNGEPVAVAIFQLPLDRVSAVMSERAGLGETGETFLVGPDHLMRSDSFLDPKNHSVLASFRRPSTGTVDTAAVKAALKGEAGVATVNDYNGNAVLSAYGPLEIMGVRWAMLAEMDVAEAEAGKRALLDEAASDVALLRWLMAGLALGAIALIVLVAVWVSGLIARPIKRTAEMLRDIAEGEGDLRVRLEVTGKDEMAELATWFNVFVEKLHGIVTDITDTTRTLAGAATEMGATATQMQANASSSAEQAGSVAGAGEEIAASSNAVAGAVEELNASIREISRNAQSVSDVAREAVKRAADTRAAIQTLGQSSQEIGEVVDLISSVAEQTNLLALNATIEAARAGDAGRGFAVVANEVKGLAGQTGEATQRIADRVSAIQSQTARSVVAIEEIQTVIERINSVQQTLSAAVEQQSATTSEIAQNVNNTASGSQEIARSIAGVAETATSTSAGATQALGASQDVAQMAERLRGLVEQFRI
jgi:methyl-accepting chemotaxis protein